jgi:hypothetical protein
MAFSKTPPLDERIKAIQAEIDKFIDDKVEEERKRSGGACPPIVIRQLLTVRAPGCHCRQYLKIKEEEA